MATDVIDKKGKAAAPAGDAEDAVPAPAEALDLNNLDQIRNILFGAKLRAYDRQLTQLEAHVAREMEAVRKLLQDRLAALETYVKEENETLGKRLKAEQQRRTEVVEEVRRDLRGTEQAFKAEQTRLEEQLAEAERSLRERLLAQSNDLTNALQEKSDALSAVMASLVDELRDQKTDRHMLADLFNELSLRLRGEFGLPEGE